MASPRQSSARVKERILQTAASLFAGNGYARTSMRELAKEADVNLALINYHFGSKKDLLKEILDLFFSGYLEVAEKELGGEGELSDKLKRFVAGTVHYFDNSRELLLVTIAELPHDDEEIVKHKAVWARHMMEIIDREFCQPLAAKTGFSIPASTLGPIFTSLMASQFLFAPVMDKAGGDCHGKLDLRSYTEVITTILLSWMSALIKTPLTITT